jgi:dolichol-phosphate mannosyltransferase
LNHKFFENSRLNFNQLNTFSNISKDVASTWEVPNFDVLFWDAKQHPWCVIIPVINEGERIKNLLSKMAALNIGSVADIIIVDGGSTDGSLDLDFLKSLGVKGLLLKIGSGKLSAQLRCAYAFALNEGFEGIITIDGNDKDDPDPIPSFIQALKSQVDFVQASRYVDGGIGENTPFSREIAIRLIHAPILSLASGFNWTDSTQGFRAYSNKILLDPKISPFREVFQGYELLAYLSYIVPKLGYKCLELPTARRYPKSEIPTKISWFKGNINVFKVLIKTVLGHYNPRTN